MSDSPPYCVQSVNATEALRSPEIVDAWNSLLRARPFINALFASPEWFGHLQQIEAEGLHVLVLRDSSGRIAGLASQRNRQHCLRFSVANRVIFQRLMPVVDLLGSQALVSPKSSAEIALWQAILDTAERGRAVYLDAMQVESAEAAPNFSSQSLPEGANLYMIDGPRPWHLAEMRGSFDEYVAKEMSRKSRANVRREVRQLMDIAGGTLEFRVVTEAAQVEPFLRDAEAVGRKSWQHRVLGPRIRNDERGRRAFLDLADRRLLRCYLIKVGDKPCAFVVGYLYHRVFHYGEVAFDQAFKDHSPGTVLLFKILEDLHEQGLSDVLNFGTGDAGYKMRFGNVERQDATCLVLRPTLSNQMLINAHFAFHGTIRLAKRVIGRKVTK